MRIFDAHEANQGGTDWWALRRGVPTSSGFDRILTPKTLKPSAQAEGYIAELCADVADQRPNWFTERANRPPNHAIEEGVRREAESRNWLAMDRDRDVLQVGFCLSDDGMSGCSPDGILLADSGCFEASLELKNPQGDTQVRYLMDGGLPPEYRCQVHGHLVVTELPRCTFLSYHPDLDPLLVEVVPDDFTARLGEALDEFVKRYLDVLTRLRLLARFEAQRKNTLSHFPREACA